jgi:osmotically-inducible protein OsmY
LTTSLNRSRSQRSTTKLRIQIATRIYRDPLFWNYAIQPVPPIHIIVENGHVTLKGVVDSEVERRVAETMARSAFGVSGVNNHLHLSATSARPTDLTFRETSSSTSGGPTSGITLSQGPGLNMWRDNSRIGL